VKAYKGKPLIDIREFYNDKSTGELKPGKKGISLTSEQYIQLKSSLSEIDDALAEIE
jgi:Transcriptional Coactivator p15 (PC4)